MRRSIAGLDVHISHEDVAGRDVLLWHHGSPQTGAILPPVRAAADARGLAVVSAARPAYAGSPRIAGRTVADVAVGLRPVLDALGVASVVSVGASGGGPHALACAAVAHARMLASALPSATVDLHPDDGHVSILRHLGTALDTATA